MTNSNFHKNTVNFDFLKIESPLVVFNNIQLDITTILNKLIFGEELTKNTNLLNQNNLIIFDDKSITLFNCFKLIENNNELFVKVLKPINNSELAILAKIYAHFNLVRLQYYRYLQMYNKIVLNYDGSVPMIFVNEIITHIKSLKTNISDLNPKYYLIPFKSKINNCVNKLNFINNKLNNYDFIVEFNKSKSPLSFDYNIFMVSNSNLDKNKSLENLRFLEKDLIRSESIKQQDVEDFVVKLFYYGEIN